MGRVYRQPLPAAPSTFEVAPHRYSIEGYDSAYREAKDYNVFKAGVPYKVGEVIYVDYAGVAMKAYIVDIGVERDFFGDRRERYRVLVQRKGVDAFSKNWEWVSPGFVQRGYASAGLAPDVVAYMAREAASA